MVDDSLPRQAACRSQNRLYPYPSGCPALYSSHSSIRVTPGRRSSACSRGQSGCGRDGSATNGGLDSLCSSVASSNPSGTGQEMPNTPARRRYSATV